MNDNEREKIVLITGATGGIGQAVAQGLAKSGATLVILARSPTRGEATRRALEASGGGKVELLAADLASLRSVRQAAEAFKAQHSQLSLLVNSAAVYQPERELTEDGLEKMFATNHLGPFLLTNLLLPLLQAGAPGRILNLTAPSTVRLDFDDLQGSQRFRSLSAFGATKMANLLFTFALARRLTGSGVTANAIHPGVVKTGLMSRAPAPLRWLTGLTGAPPERAAEAIVQVATGPEFAGQTGCFFHQAKEIQASPYAYDEAVQERLWAESARLAGLGVGSV
jgi:NAD(P)-dependent dehydrogenase (short-subunit alcohol dehydrogenase family)